MRFIRLAQSLSDIGKILQISARRDSPCPLARDIIARRIDQNQDEMRAVVALWKRMCQARNRWRRLPDHIPAGEEICRLIECGDDAKDQLRRTAKVGPGQTPGARKHAVRV